MSDQFEPGIAKHCVFSCRTSRRRDAVGRILWFSYATAVSQSRTISQFLRLLAPWIPRRSALRAGCVLLLVPGCQTDSQHATLESQLRKHEATIRELQSEVARTEELLAHQDLELAAARRSASGSVPGNFIAAGKASTVGFATEPVVAWGSVESLQLHQLTSGLLRSPDSGETELSLIWQPLDQDREVVKVAGELEVSAATVTADGVTEEVASRKYSITDSRLLWSRGLVSAGFHVTLPIPPPPPTTDHILVSAKLNLGPDRQYDATGVIGVD